MGWRPGGPTGRGKGEGQGVGRACPGCWAGRVWAGGGVGAERGNALHSEALPWWFSRTLWREIMSAVVAQTLHVFGLRSHVANNIFYFDEQIIIFPSGNHCVKYNVDQKWQKFIPGKNPFHPDIYRNGMCHI